MQDNIYKRIFDKEYQDLLTDVVSIIIANDDQTKALELGKIIENAVDESALSLNVDLRLKEFYLDIILKLKFIAFSALDLKEMASLLNKNFLYQFGLVDYDLTRKISIALLALPVIPDRTKLKNDLKEALLDNNEKISDKAKIKIIKDWLKDYLIKVGLDSQDKLAKAQYIMELKNSKDITETEYDNLKRLFNFFDWLSIPSEDVRAFEEEYPMIVNGKLHIFRKGILEPVHESKAVEEALKNYSPTEESFSADMENDDVLSDTKPLPVVSKDLPVATSSSSETPTIPEKQKNIPRTTELEEILDSYSPVSLEYKAISQEIMRLKKTEARKNAKR